MIHRASHSVVAGFMLTASSIVAAQAHTPTVVTADNFVRAESDAAFAGVVKDDGFGKFMHNRDVTPIDKQRVIRQNRDTLYSGAVIDLGAGPVTITLPDAGKRFMSMQVISEDEYTQAVIYKPGTYTFNQKQIGTRYVLMAVRTLVDPASQADMEAVHRLQDAIKVEQAHSGQFEIPKWDTESQTRVRNALLVLGSTLPDSNGMFGAKNQVSPIRHLIGAATAWGGNPERDAVYLNVTPAKNDGASIYRLTVKDVPVDGFWSVSVYNAKGFYEENSYHAYTLNSVVAKRESDGSVRLQFGGCDGKVANCLPISDGWNYMVRLYRPRAEILEGKWAFPEAQLVH